MADIKYLNYGNLQVDELALLTSMANDVQNYVNSQPWSNNRKQKFMAAYSDIMNRGILGASNDTGQWRINVGGTPYQFDQMDRKDREMYGEAAYFIQLQMNRLATTPEAEEEKKKLELKKFTNTEDIIHDRIGKNVFGGSNWEASRWNSKDVRGENGLFGTERRRKLLAELLRGYKNDLILNPVDFSETGFKNIETYNALLDSAINNLEDPNVSEQDLRDSLDRIGLNYNNYFNNGSGDIYGYKTDSEGNKIPVTYGEYYSGLKAQDEAKAKAELKKAEEIQKALDILQIINPQEVKTNYTLGLLANKYGGDLNNIISKYLNQNINSLSLDENDELVSLFRGGLSLGALSELTDDEWNTVKSKLSLDDSNRNLYRKIDGLNGIYYDINSDNIFLIGDPKLFQKDNNFLLGLSSAEKLQTYLNSKIPGLTNAEWLELSSIGLDIASIIDPEPLSALALGVGAAGFRTAAKNNTPEFKRGFWDYIGEGVDYATGAIAAIPVLGDAGLGIKIAANSGKWLPLITKALRLAARAGATTDVLSSAGPATKAVYNKIVNGEELTVGNWREVATLVRGLTGHGMLNRSNRAARRVLEKSGFETTVGDYVPDNMLTRELAREGFFSSKIKGELSIPTLRLKKTGENGEVKTKEIEISPENKTKLEEAFSKSKPEERTAKAKEILKEKMPDGYEVETNTGWWRRLASKLPLIPTKTKDSFGESYKPIERSKDTFNEYLKNRSFWDKVHYGSNSQLRGLRNLLGLSNEWKFNPETKEFRDILKGNNKHSGNAILTEAFKLGNATIDIDIPTLGSYEGFVNINLNGQTLSIRFENLKELSKKVALFIWTHRKDIFSSKVNAQKIGETSRLLKNKGVFKYGGRIIDSQIDYFLKQYK